MSRASRGGRPLRPRLRACAALAATLALAGCAGIGENTNWSDLRSNPREFFNLVPPVRVAVGEGALAAPVTLKPGQALIVRLPEDPASGLTWRMRPLPRGAVIAPVQHDHTAAPGVDPARSGGAAEATFRLRGVAPGTQAVTLDYLRPGFVTPEKSVAFDVIVM